MDSKLVHKKVLDFGKIAYTGKQQENAVEVELNLKSDKGRLCFSVSTNVWNLKHSDIIMCGQCIDEIKNFIQEPEKLELLNKISKLARRNHLNDMRAGTIEQTAAIESYLNRTGNHYNYTEICNYLKSIGLYEVSHPETGKPYRYGHEWLYHPISDEDLAAIKEIMGIDNERVQPEEA